MIQKLLMTRENITPWKISAKKAEEELEPTKNANNVKTTSLSHSSKLLNNKSDCNGEN